jgi:hypothetical protein
MQASGSVIRVRSAAEGSDPCSGSGAFFGGEVAGDAGADQAEE